MSTVSCWWASALLSGLRTSSILTPAATESPVAAEKLGDARLDGFGGGRGDGREGQHGEERGDRHASILLFPGPPVRGVVT